MKNTNETGSKRFIFVDIGEHTKDNIADKRKQQVKKLSIVKEVNT